MSMVPPGHSARAHEQRSAAEGFGEDARRYDRSRPSYPEALVERILAGREDPDLLDVGCGTGIASRLFRRAGCRVLGVEVDARMAEVVTDSGIPVEVAKFEDWDPGGRVFDVVVAAQTWHWVDPVLGARQVAQVLRPGGRVAMFWNAAQEPAALRRAIAQVYGRVLPGTPAANFYQRTDVVVDAYGEFLDVAADGLAETGAFDEFERWRFDWEQPFTRAQWLDQVQTRGGYNLLSRNEQEELMSGLGAVVDAGGGFTMSYSTVAVSALRR